MNKTLNATFIAILSLSFADGFADDQSLLGDPEKPVLQYNANYIKSPNKKAPWFGRSGFIHPVYTPNRKVITEGFPKGSHMHQHGLMFAWVNTAFEGQELDFWNSKKKLAKIEHVETLQHDAQSMTVKLRHVKESKPKPISVLDEQWKITLVPNEKVNVFDLVSTQKCAGNQSLKINEYHYGGMAIRSPAAWHRKVKMLTSNGDGKIKGNHTRPNWVAMFSDIDGEVCGIAAMCHPSNFRAPQPVRLHNNFPYFCFAPPVLGDFEIKPGADYISKYRFVAFDGEPDIDLINQIWQEYSKSAPEKAE